ncbi:hypothetical protein G6O69_13500 [Pseudenhygromyxa sp. WMMC2535]|uniref:hypothetical protein n=1 Tax=Pseudenhygromyxa sp. WMMC2535 TaxID=2712867 RepID=UPI0015551B34|nr:hypothetical protein [Pseudenhygromyxa sp. WMMC2535]NVB38851.1 hypothetical protein [Pseudenhygromyxa sp. WMMC2535]
MTSDAPAPPAPSNSADSATSAGSAGLLDPSRLRLGATTGLIAGALFIIDEIASFFAGFPPSDPGALADWVAAGRVPMIVANEAAGIGTGALVPFALGLHHAFARQRRGLGVAAAGLLGCAAPLWLVLVVIQGRLIYPMFGQLAGDEHSLRLLVQLLFGGLHTLGLVLAMAALFAGLAVRQDAHALDEGTNASALAGFGAAVFVMTLAGTFPEQLGVTATAICRASFGLWVIVWSLHLRRLAGLCSRPRE